MRSAWSRSLCLVLAYGVAAVVSWCLTAPDVPPPTTAVWLGTAVIFVACLLARPTATLLLAAWGVAWVWGMLGFGLPLGHSAMWALIEVLSAAVGAWVAHTPGPRAQALHGAMRLVAGAAVTAALSAALAAALWGLSATPLAQVPWRQWALGSFTGILLLAPVAVAYQGFQARRSGGMPQRQFLAGLLAFAFFAVLAWLVFSPDVHRTGTLAPTLAYLPMPLLLVASMLWGPRGGSVAWLLGGLLVIGRSAAGGGPFAAADAFAGEAVLEAQAFVTVWSLLMLFGRGLEQDRSSALLHANEWRLRYERSMTAQQVLTAEFDAVTGAATWAPGAQSLLGDSAPSLDSMPAWLAKVDVGDRPLAQAAWQQACGGHTPVPHTYQVQLNGQKRTVQASLAPVQGPDGEVEMVTAWMRLHA